MSVRVEELEAEVDHQHVLDGECYIFGSHNRIVLVGVVAGPAPKLNVPGSISRLAQNAHESPTTLLEDPDRADINSFANAKVNVLYL
jgi:hypothetical protein